MTDFQMEGHYAAFSLTISASGGGRCRAFDRITDRESARQPGEASAPGRRIPPGQTADLIARLMGQWLTERLDQPVMIDNRPGASSNVATELVVRSPIRAASLTRRSTRSFLTISSTTSIRLPASTGVLVFSRANASARTVNSPIWSSSATQMLASSGRLTIMNFLLPWFMPETIRRPAIWSADWPIKQMAESGHFQTNAGSLRVY
jgi:hypothetical protein